MRTAWLVAMLIPLLVNAQPPDSSWVRYQGGMDLREGIYRDFQSFRMNAPTWPQEVLKDEQGLPVADVRRAARVKVPGDSGSYRELDLDRMWGFCHRNVVYIRAGNGFYRIGLMGSLCHVLYEYNYRDWDPYMYPGGTVTRTAIAQFLLDMETGRFLDFNASSMQEVLARDPVLSAEYEAIPARKRKEEVLFYFLRHYNDRHPLYFPR